MINDKLLKLDLALREKKEREEKAAPFLRAQALKIERIDKNIKFHEDKISDLEKTKQAELEIMQELFDTAVIGHFDLHDTYKISTSLSRKMKINDVQAFLLWLKKHCTPTEVLSFFEDSLKATAIKKFVEQQCDKQRKAGEISPHVDGIDLGDVNFRRLTTTYKGDK